MPEARKCPLLKSAVILLKIDSQQKQKAKYVFSKSMDNKSQDGNKSTYCKLTYKKGEEHIF